MSTPRTTAVTVAALAAFVATAPLGVATAAPTTAPRLIKIAASVAPKIIDRPGTGKDVVRLTNLPGVRWSVTGDVDETTYEAPFSTSEKVVDVPVKASGEGVVVTASVADAATTELAADVYSWTLPFTTATVAVKGAERPRAQDFPGTSKDAVQLTAVEGVTWEVNDADTDPEESIPAFKGTKSFSLSRLKASGSSITVTAQLDDSYEGTVDPTPLAFTSGTTVDLQTRVIEAAVVDPSNLPGRTRDTLTLLPVTGVKWSICGGKLFVVTKRVVKSASCKVEDVVVKTVADKGYTIGSKPDYVHPIPFKDASAQMTIAVPSAAVTPHDVAGTANDTMSIKTVPNVTWQVAVPTTDKAGKPAWKWTNAPKPKASSPIVVKMKFAKSAEGSILFVRPVPVDDDFALSGWTANGDASAEDGATFRTTAELGEITLGAEDVPTAAANLDVALPAVEGITAWNVVRTVPTGTKTKDVKSVVKVAPYSSVVAGANHATKIVVTPVVDKSYEFKSTPTPWTFPTPTAP